MNTKNGLGTAVNLLAGITNPELRFRLRGADPFPMQKVGSLNETMSYTMEFGRELNGNWKIVLHSNDYQDVILEEWITSDVDPLMSAR